MLAWASYILVIIRVCVGERKMAGGSLNSSGRGRDTRLHGNPKWFPGVAVWAPTVSRGPPSLAPAVNCSRLGLDRRQASCCSVAPLGMQAKEGAQRHFFTWSPSTRGRNSLSPGRNVPKKPEQPTGLAFHEALLLWGAKEKNIHICWRPPLRESITKHI